MDFRKQLNKEIKPINRTSNVSIFKDESFSFIYKKTERLSTAIYLITNLMSSEEPIKWDLRKTSIKLMDKVMSLSNATLSSRDTVLRDINKKLFHLISLYNISYRSGFISEMNYEIVNKELNNLTSFISEYNNQDIDSRNKLFDEEFFKKDINEINKEQIKKDIVVKDNIKQKDTNLNKDNQSYKRQNKSHEKTSGFSNKSQERNKRREDIINIIKQKKNVSVKDISNIIKDTSEKTLQRELVSMVDEGVLKKEGERRWSRYMLNN